MIFGRFPNGITAAFKFTPTLTGSYTDYNLRSAALSAGWNGTAPLTATITLSGTMQGSSISTYAFDTGSPFPNGSKLTLILTGGGLNWIRGYNASFISGSGQGGPAVHAQYALSITNNGSIDGGAGNFPSGPQGYCAVGNANITWVVPGTRTGPLI